MPFVLVYMHDMWAASAWRDVRVSGISVSQILDVGGGLCLFVVFVINRYSYNAG